MKKIQCWILFFSFAFSLTGQQIEELEIVADYQNETLEVILDNLSREYGLTIYTAADSLPARPVTHRFRAAPLSEVLTILLQGTGLDYVTYRSYLIVIGPGDKLSGVYAPEYYQAMEDILTAGGEEAPEDQLLEIGNIENISPDGRADFTGKVVDAQSGEPVIGATITFPDLEIGDATDEDGRFVISLPVGKHRVAFSYLGYTPLSITLQIYHDGEAVIPLNSKSMLLDEVVVRAEAADINIQSATIGATRLSVEEIRKLPSFLGEVDIIKSLLQQPGVSSVGESAGGFNVRGGNVDQNLVLMDEHFVFNTTHALGFFSAFNPDLINRVTLFKGHIPAQFGGRLSSVLEIEMLDGDREQFKMSGGIGAVSTRLTAQGPVIRDKSSFIAGFRTTYSDWVLRLVNTPEVQNSSAGFYDANLRYTHRFNENNQMIFSFYSSQDRTQFNEEFGFNYATLGGQVTYKNIFNPTLTSALSVTASQYEATGTELRDSLTASSLFSRYRYLKAKEVLTWLPGNELEVRGGLSGIFYKINAGDQEPLFEQSTVDPVFLQPEQALEAAAFTQVDWSISDRISASAGLRFVVYHYFGPRTYYEYSDPEHPANESITGQRTASSGTSISAYQSLEPRFSLRYLVDAATSVKFGYSRNAQFINQLANLTTPTPVSVWQLSNQYIRPQRAHSLSMGFFKNFRNNTWEASVEAYYRHQDRLTDYRDFARLPANPNIETELLRGTGRAYGLELSVKRNAGKVTGFVNYTYSRAFQKVAGINKDDWYPAIYDKPHDVTASAIWQITGRISASFNFNYSRGRPITAPLGRYLAGGQFPVLRYSGRNQVRIPDYHRLDLAITVDRGYKKTQRLKYNWTISVYNVYGRRNAYSVFFEPAGGLPETIRLSVLGSAFPSLTLNFFFQ